MTQTQEFSRLETTFNVVSLSVLSSSQISNRASVIVEHLTSNHGTSGKPPLCRIQAKAKVANKLISIVEIVKRDLKAKGVTMCQYSSLTSELVTLKQNDETNGTKPASSDLTDREEGDDSFQTMVEKDKIRSVPVMTVILSGQAIKDLRSALG